jgi:hypothetical protein
VHAAVATVFKRSWAPAALTGVFLVGVGISFATFLPALHTVADALRLLSATTDPQLPQWPKFGRRPRQPVVLDGFGHSYRRMN